MLLDAERRRLETVHGMAGGAFARIGALHELSIMLVLVAVHALPKNQRLLEIATLMTCDAANFLVLAL